VAETILAQGQADMVSMARPFLADPDFVAKAARGEAARIAPCIACNQACLDHTFSGKLSSCLVNPRACHETELVLAPASAPRRIAVVGAGPAGLSSALALAERGHAVTLFDKADRIGGQLHYAAAIPGKEEFRGLIDWFEAEIGARTVDLRLGHAPELDELTGFDEVIVATGVRPRDPGIPGQEGPNVISYADLLSGRAQAGPRVAVVGAGGIGFDVAEYLVTGHSTTINPPAWRTEWGLSDPSVARGGLAPEGPRPDPAIRRVTLLQRKAEKLGKRLGKTTGWVHRAGLQMRAVEMLGGVSYERIDAQGLHVTTPDGPRLIEADTIVLCAGQESERGLADALLSRGVAAHVIGGAEVAAELDAKRAIDRGTRLAATL